LIECPKNYFTTFQNRIYFDRKYNYICKLKHFNILFRLYKHEESKRGPLTKTWLTELRQLCKGIEAAREMKVDAPEQKPAPHMVSCQYKT
jgi:hypothetical protein